MNVIGNITITTIQPVAFSHHGIESLPMMTRGVDPTGQPQKTVFYPAAAVRGAQHQARRDSPLWYPSPPRAPCERGRCEDR